MNSNQNMQPGVKSGVIGEPGGNPGFGKIRRKLGLTFVLSNPFRVPVAQSPARPAASEATAKKPKPESI